MHDGYLKVAACTPDIRVADVAYNTEQICRQIAEASDLGAKVIVFPELCVTGATCGDLFLQETLLHAAEESLFAIMRFTQGHGSDAVVFAGLPMEMDGKIYNTAAVIQTGKVLALIPKRYLSDSGVFSESRYFAPGNESPVPVETFGDVVPFGTRTLIDATAGITGLQIGCEIGEDAFVKEAPDTELCASGVTLLVHLAAAPALIGADETVKTHARDLSARLITGYVYAGAGIGESSAEGVYGGARLVCEDGMLLAEGALFENGITISEIDISSILAERRRRSSYTCISCADDKYHRAVISFAPDETMLSRTVEAFPFVPEDREELAKRCEHILQVQSIALAKRLTHTNCKRVVVGVSGGLDSTLAMLVCARAFDRLSLARDGILGITMPCFGTTDRTYKNACDLTKALGATLREIPIRDAVTQHFQDIGQDIDTHDVTYENAQARERTQVLMDLANKEGALVVGTGDLSELALGWCTYNGDQTSMYGVNGSVPKTLMRAIVKHVASREENALKAVLDDILDTPVSPELVPPKDGVISQKTEEIVGPYELHDFFLYYTLRRAFSPRKIYRLACKAFSAEEDAGNKDAGKKTAPVYDADTIKHWMQVFYRRFFSQQYKRANLPDGPAVGSVSLSPRTGLRMPSDAVADVWLDEVEALA